MTIAACGAPAEVPTTTTTFVEEIMELAASNEPLVPGVYTRSDFAPQVTFEVVGEWYAVQRVAGFFDIQRDVGSPDVIAVQFANVSEVYDTDGSAVAPDDAAGATAIIESNSDLVVLGKSGSVIDGREGSVVEVENAGTTHVQVLKVPAGALGIDPGRRLWIALFDSDDGIFGILVGGSVERWEEALLAAEPVLETVTIEG